MREEESDSKYLLGKDNTPYKILKKAKTDGYNSSFIIAEPPNKKDDLVAIKLPLFPDNPTSIDLLRKELKYRGDAIQREREALERLKGIDEVAQLIDIGNHYYPEPKFRPSERWVPFNVIQFFPTTPTVSQIPDPALNLQQWAKNYAGHKGDANFTGLKEIGVWIDFAFQLINILSKIHARKVVHGDLNPANILVCTSSPEYPNGQLRLIDFGWGIDVAATGPLSAKRNRWYHHCAPERVKCGPSNPKWYTPADIYSLGYTLLFLAAGRSLIKPFIKGVLDRNTSEGNVFTVSKSVDFHNPLEIEQYFRPESDIKSDIIFCLKKNKELYSACPSLAEIIMSCMRPKALRRIINADGVHQQLAAIVPKTFLPLRKRINPKKLFLNLRNQISSTFHPVISNIILNDIERLESETSNHKDIIERFGQRNELMLDITTCIGEMTSGKIHGVLAVALIQEENMGADDFFLASLLNAHHAGVSIKIAFVSDGSSRHKQLVERLKIGINRQRLARQLSKRTPRNRKSLEIRNHQVDKINYARFIQEHGSLLALYIGNEIITIDANYAISGGVLSGLRFVIKNEHNPEFSERFTTALSDHFDCGKPL